jgi:hypothetical protein
MDKFKEEKRAMRNWGNGGKGDTFAIEEVERNKKSYCSSKSLTNNKMTALTINSVVAWH